MKKLNKGHYWVKVRPFRKPNQWGEWEIAYFTGKNWYLQGDYFPTSTRYLKIDSKEIVRNGK